MDGSSRLMPLSNPQQQHRGSPPPVPAFVNHVYLAPKMMMPPPPPMTSGLTVAAGVINPALTPGCPQPLILPSVQMAQFLMASGSMLPSSTGSRMGMAWQSPFQSGLSLPGAASVNGETFPTSVPDMMFQRFISPFPAHQSVANNRATDSVDSGAQRTNQPRPSNIPVDVTAKRRRVIDTDVTDYAESSSDAEHMVRDGAASSRNYRRNLETKSIELPPSGSEQDDGDEPEPINTSPSGVATAVPGERRLVIHFESFGERGDPPQYYGKTGIIIPNGVIGVHTVYHEKWRFEIRHSDLRVSPKIVRLTWRVINLTTNESTERTETANEATARASIGRTITNQLFRQAMEQRAVSLEESVDAEGNVVRVANVKSLIKVLRPNRFTQGPLVFGLQHKTVQEAMGTIFLDKDNK